MEEISESTEVQRCAAPAPGPPCGQQQGWTLQHRPHSGAELCLGPSGADNPGADALAARAPRAPLDAACAALDAHAALTPSVSASSALDSTTLYSLQLPSRPCLVPYHQWPFCSPVSS